ncbi:hypothetical protein SAMN02745196_01042 [Clostridium collagenovorans DSM 3089]|uniref:DUF4342 domain-containing protein n=1 Tax=Clostridium collagenovorans DSM 3089 TaxID=1121306 RepID=A0A1M5V0U5_9CLOT|nr:DUF4342 domain-containing protein [Clostridium collagenovorans]SHH68927.1 hypothetical protein SAMN02745196_01042 [Clostridium collagenovorans DSM 3089]
MERNEMIQVLMSKVNVSYEEAQVALEICNWDMLEAVLYLERSGKVPNEEVTTMVKVPENNNDYKQNSKNNEHFGGIGEILGRMFKFAGKILKKGNDNYFEVRKENEKPIRVSVTISVILLVFLAIPTSILLVAGLFCGYKYSIVGENINYDGVNSVFEEVSKSADSIKKDFKKGYER